VFVSGRGIGTARALFEASHDVPGLSIPLRKEVRVYYQASGTPLCNQVA
jgi:hypothetical protein